MTRVSKTTVAVGVVSSVLALASAASPAWAKTSLQLDDAHAPATTATISLFANTGAECLLEEHGDVTTNGKPTDKLSFEAPFLHSCAQSGAPLSGTVTQATISAAGALKLKLSPKLAVTSAGPCVYEFSKLAFHVEIPGHGVASTATNTGTRNSGSSLPSCAKKSAIEFRMEIYGPSKYDLETLLIG